MSAVYSTPGSSTGPSSRSQTPLGRDIELVRGDHLYDGDFFWENVVWTPQRPTDADEFPLYHSSEEVPEGVEASPTELVAPYDRKYWFTEMRSSYLSTVRYYNGWVPWYGTRPNPRWYQSSSLGAFGDVTAVYDTEEGGTKVYIDYPSHRTDRLNPGGRYRWDLRSASVWSEKADGTPTSFTKVRTHLSGKVVVRASWTMGIPLGGPGS
jgi:hypothetical protein